MYLEILETQNTVDKDEIDRVRTVISESVDDKNIVHIIIYNNSIITTLNDLYNLRLTITKENKFVTYKTYHESLDNYDRKYETHKILFIRYKMSIERSLSPSRLAITNMILYFSVDTNSIKHKSKHMTVGGNKIIVKNVLVDKYFGELYDGTNVIVYMGPGVTIKNLMYMIVRTRVVYVMNNTHNNTIKYSQLRHVDGLMNKGFSSNYMGFNRQTRNLSDLFNKPKRTFRTSNFDIYYNDNDHNIVNSIILHGTPYYVVSRAVMFPDMNLSPVITNDNKFNKTYLIYKDSMYKLALRFNLN